MLDCPRVPDRCNGVPQTDCCQHPCGGMVRGDPAPPTPLGPPQADTQVCRLANWDLAAGDLRYNASQQPHSCLAQLGLACEERLPLQAPVHGSLLRHWVEVAAQVSPVTGSAVVFRLPLSSLCWQFTAPNLLVQMLGPRAGAPQMELAWPGTLGWGACSLGFRTQVLGLA